LAHGWDGGIDALSSLPTTLKEHTMNYRHLVSAAACVAALGLAGCSSNPTSQQVGTGVGAVAGGVVGSALGGTAATVGGAAAGALIGSEVGKDRDRQNGRR